MSSTHSALTACTSRRGDPQAEPPPLLSPLSCGPLHGPPTCGASPQWREDCLPLGTSCAAGGGTSPPLAASWQQHSLQVSLNIFAMAKEMFELPSSVFVCSFLKGGLCPELSMILALMALAHLLRKCFLGFSSSVSLAASSLWGCSECCSYSELLDF